MQSYYLWIINLFLCFDTYVLNPIEIDRSGPAAILTEDQQLEEEIRHANEQLAEVNHNWHPSIDMLKFSKFFISYLLPLLCVL